MPKKQFGAEQIVPKLRQIEVLLGQGKNVAISHEEIRASGLTSDNFRSWPIASNRLTGPLSAIGAQADHQRTWHNRRE